ncbi:hypothetical protein [Streptomyces sp. NPDC086010]|uniref:hypothetical protein n=1 Tax=Streptomyces sp. NPDC086010 TaxID=3365745 RepID=UPI0037CCCA22
MDFAVSRYVEASGLVHAALGYRPVLGQGEPETAYRRHLRQVTAVVTVARAEAPATAKGKEREHRPAGTYDELLVSHLANVINSLDMYSNAVARAVKDPGSDHTQWIADVEAVLEDASSEAERTIPGLDVRDVFLLYRYDAARTHPDGPPVHLPGETYFPAHNPLPATERTVIVPSPRPRGDASVTAGTSPDRTVEEAEHGRLGGGASNEVTAPRRSAYVPYGRSRPGCEATGGPSALLEPPGTQQTSDLLDGDVPDELSVRIRPSSPTEDSPGAFLPQSDEPVTFDEGQSAEDPRVVEQVTAFSAPSEEEMLRKLQLSAFAEDVRPALRVWNRPAADEGAELENVLRAWGSRSLVFGTLPDSPVWAFNTSGRIVWLSVQGDPLASSPRFADGPVVSIDLDNNGQLTGPASDHAVAIGARTAFCDLNLGADLQGVLGWRASGSGAAVSGGPSRGGAGQGPSALEDGPKAFLDAPRPPAGN